MRAVRLSARNTFAVADVPQPEPADGDETVRVEFASVNPLDAQVADGQLGRTDESPPLTLGNEGVGTVGERLVLVTGSGLGIARDGTYAEFVSAPSAALFDVPAGVPAQAAAATGVAGSTAWLALHGFGAIEPDSTVLVLGASGGVGTFAVQLARLAGANVIAQTGHPAKAASLEELGASVVVAADGIALAGSSIEAPAIVIDPLGGTFTAGAVEVAGSSARIVLFGAAAGPNSLLDVRLLYRKGVSIRTFSGGTITPEQRRSSVERVLALVGDGSLHVPIHAVLPLASAGQAHALLAGRSVVGKVLLDPSA